MPQTRSNSSSDREPCPWRIIEDIGGAFAMGAVGGSVFHSFKGARNAPEGSRLRGSLSAIKARAPVLGGNFAVWGGIFAGFDCSLTAIRRKEDPWNAIVSGAATGGLLAARAGPRAAGSSALIGGVLLALIEGLGIMITKVMAPAPPTAEDYAASGGEMVDPTAPPTMGGLAPQQQQQQQQQRKRSNREDLLQFDMGSSGGGGFDDDNTFSSSYLTDSEKKGNGSSGGGGWWPFGK